MNTDPKPSSVPLWARNAMAWLTTSLGDADGDGIPWTPKDWTIIARSGWWLVKLGASLLPQHTWVAQQVEHAEELEKKISSFPKP